jgi:hypothetical protein
VVLEEVDSVAFVWSKPNIKTDLPKRTRILGKYSDIFRKLGDKTGSFRRIDCSLRLLCFTEMLRFQMVPKQEGIKSHNFVVKTR